ncbi:hypothetical protein GS966_11165 [Rhodococcus hoagii]|nr:hypothetical protein [Prescottella equi]
MSLTIDKHIDLMRLSAWAQGVDAEGTAFMRKQSRAFVDAKGKPLVPGDLVLPVTVSEGHLTA